MTQLRFVGVGGQGVILAGEILSAAKIADGGYGIKASTYTSQVRGGPTKVDILLSDDEILYPYANEGEIDFMLATAQKSYDAFKDGVKEGGIIVIEPNLVKPSEEDKKRWKIYNIPIISIAKDEVGNVITQSVVALGVAMEFTHVMDMEKVRQRMLDSVPDKVKAANEKAYELGIKYAKEGNYLFDISAAIGNYAQERGYGVVRDLCGHGIGTALHEAPEIPNYKMNRKGVKLKAGMTLAIEPMINIGTWEVDWLDDDWTVVSRDRSLSAHYENTVLITKDEPILLTLTQDS